MANAETMFIPRPIYDDGNSNSRRSFSIRHEKMTVCVGEPAVYLVKPGERIERFYRALSISNGKQTVPICWKFILNFVYFVWWQGV